MMHAAVVGSGPNGLAAALTLAKAGVEVTVYEAAESPGGGARSTQATLDGLVHDHCAGFHPLAVDNAFTKFAQLEEYGLQWAWPEVQYAHPLDDGDGAAAYRSVAQTAEGLQDPSWKHLFGSLTEQFPTITRDFLQPMLRLPDAPLLFANFGLRFQRMYWLDCCAMNVPEHSLPVWLLMPSVLCSHLVQRPSVLP
ncbi:MAG: FAD-dependent oxidoreductase [Yaniella sp.]|nr:FAD-dependent oxidoreductase [Yaniella sp.]